MSDTKSFTFEGNGYKFEVELKLVEGVVKATVTAVEGSADFNAFYWGDDVNDGNSVGLKGPLNMNGEGSVYDGQPVDWDGAQRLSDPGLGRAGQNKDTFIAEGGEKTFTLNMSAEDFANLDFLGIRATSVNGGDSLKLVGQPEVEEPPPPPADDFPMWGQDISNVILVFDQTAGDDSPVVRDKGKIIQQGDGYYTVKIDNWPGAADDDLDNSIDDILAWLIANDPNIDANSDLLGVIIKGGIQDTNFYAYGDNNTNGTAPDTPPEGLGLSWDGSSNPQPANAVDESYDYAAVIV